MRQKAASPDEFEENLLREFAILALVVGGGPAGSSGSKNVYTSSSYFNIFLNL